MKPSQCLLLVAERFEGSAAVFAAALVVAAEKQVMAEST
jgi:hypothetical protein